MLLPKSAKSASPITKNKSLRFACQHSATFDIVRVPLKDGGEVSGVGVSVSEMIWRCEKLPLNKLVDGFQKVPHNLISLLLSNKTIRSGALQGAKQTQFFKN